MRAMRAIMNQRMPTIAKKIMPTMLIMRATLKKIMGKKITWRTMMKMRMIKRLIIKTLRTLSRHPSKNLSQEDLT
jgi:hypothetical protein